jgi:hypothetical protein
MDMKVSLESIYLKHFEHVVYPLFMRSSIIEKGIYAYDVDIEWVKQYYAGSGGQDMLRQGKNFTFLCPSPECDQPIDMSLPWVCPRTSCRHVNNGRTHSIFETCEGCRMTPRAFQCYECGFIFGLTHDVKFYELKKYAYRENMWRPEKFPTLKPAPVQPAPEPVKTPEPPFIPHGIPRERRFEHTLILADTGWGKTWLMKKLAWHYMQARDSVIILDSEGGFLKDALRWRKDADVIFIDFTDPENVPCLSMFDVKLSSDPRERERIRMGMTTTYRYVFTSLLGAGKTPSQISLLENIAELMLHIAGANITTIKNILFDIRPYLAEVRKLNQHARDFFERDFPTKEWKEVGRQVMNRINSVLSNPILARVLSQPHSKIDLFKAMNQGKMIVVNVDHSHLQDATDILGRFFIGHLFQAALRRDEGIEYRPAMFFIDEGWRYFDETVEKMFNTIRKRRLGLVLATQQISQFKNVSMSLRTAAFQSAIKFIGRTTDAENVEALREVGLDPKSHSTRNLS